MSFDKGQNFSRAQKGALEVRVLSKTDLVAGRTRYGQPLRYAQLCYAGRSLDSKQSCQRQHEPVIREDRGR